MVVEPAILTGAEEPGVADELLLIGEFSALSGLSAKALRLYDELALLVPVRVDGSSGYRWYSQDQLTRARLVALLRHLDMPLARIGEVLGMPAADAASAVRRYWSEVETAVHQRWSSVDYLCALLTDTDHTMNTTYDTTIASVPDRAVLSAVRHVHIAEAGVVMGEVLGRMSRAGAGLPWPHGCPYAVYYGAVSDDSDGPIEIVRPMLDLELAQAAAASLGDAEARTELAHDEVRVALTMAETVWPAMMPALDALAAYAQRLGRTPSGPARQIMVADWRTAQPDDYACDLALPLAGPTRC